LLGAGFALGGKKRKGLLFSKIRGIENRKALRSEGALSLSLDSMLMRAASAFRCSPDPGEADRINYFDSAPEREVDIRRANLVNEAR